MGRPPKCRRVEFLPQCTFFKPAGIPLWSLEEVALTVEDVEALRLKDQEGLEQEKCAERMGISRPTFQRILTGARQKVTQALVEGKAIRVEGGNYEYVSRRLRCGQCRAEWDSQPTDPAEPPCPKCGGEEIARMPHRRCHSRLKGKPEGSPDKS
ncbi:MAG: DUF134 domain-containing protein [Eubacteriales bacterium]|nr:DUF134 domain-containing protein [Bacillota bacterium]MBV1727963.1 DUF134 domain-containing protein [Desulforudis sp.]MDP3051144.1 DUF134 domain-containing protein [Eubacteriales bacterium]MDQ7789099.1 DUF134 domain-containing protein [Clostridia bacterium]MBU4553500.1 DUF134 domain-containing protein [Bacillota bacterium]